MSEAFGEFLIQISTSESESHEPPSTKSPNKELIGELQQYLYPGVEIALVFEGYAAITTVLWLSELRGDGTMCARVRLLGLSAVTSSPIRGHENRIHSSQIVSAGSQNSIIDQNQELALDQELSIVK